MFIKNETGADHEFVGVIICDPQIKNAVVRLHFALFAFIFLQGKMKEIMNDFYRMADLIDKERETNNVETENGVSTEKDNDDSLGDGDYYIEPVSRKTTGKTSKDEL